MSGVGSSAQRLAGLLVSSAPRRIQRQRTKGWRMPRGAVYVGRTIAPSRWGNPFIAGCRVIDADGAIVDVRDAAHAVALYRRWMEKWLRDFPDMLDELRGRDLACWCALDAPCHADVLLDLANRPRVVRGAGDLPTVLADLRPGPVTPEFC